MKTQTASTASTDVPEAGNPRAAKGRAIGNTGHASMPPVVSLGLPTTQYDPTRRIQPRPWPPEA